MTYSTAASRPDAKPITLQEIDLTQRDEKRCEEIHDYLTAPDEEYNYDFFDLLWLAGYGKSSHL